MNVWLRTLLSLSVSGTLLTVILSGSIRLFGGKLGSSWRYYIWLLAVFRLALPVAAPVNLVGTLFNAYGTASWTGESADFGQAGAGTESAAQVPLELMEENAMANYMGNPLADSPDLLASLDIPDHQGQQKLVPPNNGVAGPEKLPDTFPAIAMLGALWFTVALELFGRKVLNYIHALGQLKNGEGRAVHLEEPFNRACGDLRLRRKPELFENSRLPSPVAAGILHPFVAVPADIPADRAYYIFLHELTHIKRRDALYKWVVELAVCLHWFNPVVYVIRRETARACELSCDEAVIQGLDMAGRRMYGSLLLDTLRHGMMPFGPMMTMPLGENAKWMKERLGKIMSYRKKGKGYLCAAVILSGVLAIGAVLCGFAPARLGGTAGAASNIMGSGKAALVNSSVLQGYNGSLIKSGADNLSQDQVSWNSDDILRREDQKGYQSAMSFENGYIIGLAWNVDSSQYDTVREIDGKKICFTGKTASYADNASVIEGVRQMILNRKDGTGHMLEEAVVLGADGPFTDTPDQLLRRFYDAGNLTYFAAVIHKASANACAQVAKQSYEDQRLEYFAIALDGGEPVSQNFIASIAEQAARDGRVEFFSIAADDLPDSVLGEYAQEAYNGNHIDIFYMTCKALSPEQAWEIAEKSYKDDRIEYLYAVIHRLTDARRRELLDRAKQDGNSEYWYALQ